MGTADHNLKDYVYYPSEETIVFYLRQLQSHGREGTKLPSAIKWRQVYTSEVMEASDFKESWMEDFPVGASGDRHAKWYATNLTYNSKGKGTRSTPRGGHWNLRATWPFDDYNRKILTPRKEIEKNNCRVAFIKKQLRYRKGKEETPWKMIEFTIGEVQAQFAICQIFPVQPMEPSQDDDVPLAAAAVGATNHAASVPRPGPHLQEAQCTAVVAQDETARRCLDNASNAGLSPKHKINFPDFSSYIRSQQTSFETPTISSVEGHQQLAPDLGMYASSYPRQDMNHQRAWNEGNFTSRMDHFQLPQDLLAQNIYCWPGSPLISGYSHSLQAQIFQTEEKGRNSDEEELSSASNEEEFRRGVHVPNREQSSVESSKEKHTADAYITNVKKKSKLERSACLGGATNEKDLAQAKKHKGECNILNLQVLNLILIQLRSA